MVCLCLVLIFLVSPKCGAWEAGLQPLVKESHVAGEGGVDFLSFPHTTDEKMQTYKQFYKFCDSHPQREKKYKSTLFRFNPFSDSSSV